MLDLRMINGNSPLLGDDRGLLSYFMGRWICCFRESAIIITCYPKPMYRTFIYEQRFGLHIFTADGIKVREQLLNSTKGDVELGLESLSSGSYVVTITGGDIRVQTHLIKK